MLTWLAGKEFYNTVRFYGHHLILKRYARFPTTLPMPVGVQHGWTYFAHDSDFTSFCPELWLWSKKMADIFKREYKDLPVRVVGAPFLYKLRQLNYEERPLRERRGSIVYPAHSTEAIDVDFDYESYAAMLLSLPEEYKPITICMYYKDFDKNRHEVFKKSGFKIVTNGQHRLSSDYLATFIRNAEGKRYAFSNQLTTALLYANMLGLTSYLKGPDYKMDNRANRHMDHFDNKHHVSHYEATGRYFQFPDVDFLLQRDFVQNELGTDFMMGPDEMRKLLVKHTVSLRYVLNCYRYAS